MIARALPMRELSLDDMAAIEDVLDAAAAWKAGELPLFDAAKIGTIENWRGVPSAPYTRYLALRVVDAGDPRRAALLELVDRLVAAQGYRTTRQGVFGAGEINANSAGFDPTKVRPVTWNEQDFR